MGKEGVGDVVPELESLGVVVDQHRCTGTQRAMRAQKYQGLALKLGNRYQTIHSRMMAKAVGWKLRQLEKSGGVPVAREGAGGRREKSLLGVGPGGGVGVVGDHVDHPEQPSPWGFVKNCMYKYFRKTH